MSTKNEWFHRTKQDPVIPVLYNTLHNNIHMGSQSCDLCSDQSTTSIWGHSLATFVLTNQCLACKTFCDPVWLSLATLITFYSDATMSFTAAWGGGIQTGDLTQMGLWLTFPFLSCQNPVWVWRWFRPVQPRGSYDLEGYWYLRRLCGPRSAYRLPWAQPVQRLAVDINTGTLYFTHRFCLTQQFFSDKITCHY